jgi:hypothetical protein
MTKSGTLSWGLSITLLQQSMMQLYWVETNRNLSDARFPLYPSPSWMIFLSGETYKILEQTPSIYSRSVLLTFLKSRSLAYSSRHPSHALVLNLCPTSSYSPWQSILSVFKLQTGILECKAMLQIIDTQAHLFSVPISNNTDISVPREATNCHVEEGESTMQRSEQRVRKK